jgi:hypothetical protein
MTAREKLFPHFPAEPVATTASLSAGKRLIERRVAPAE